MTTAVIFPHQRILVTGSRTWQDRDTLWDAVTKTAYTYPKPLLISGACLTGADALAEQCFEALKLPVERHPADWETLGKRAGFVRNAEMVNLGAEVCLAFIRNSSKGATMTMELAVKKGIPVMLYREDD